MTPEQKKELPPPVSMEVGSISKNGDIEISFNQKLVVPDVIKASGGGCKSDDESCQKKVNRRRLYIGEGEHRRLIGMGDISPSEFINVQTVQKDGAPSQGKFSLTLGEWTPYGIKLKMNFNSPLAISQGGFND